MVSGYKHERAAFAHSFRERIQGITDEATVGEASGGGHSNRKTVITRRLGVVSVECLGGCTHLHICG